MMEYAYIEGGMLPYFEKHASYKENCAKETLANIHVNNRQPNRRNGVLPKTNSTLSMQQMRQDTVKRTGSFVVGQKLRESKWFNHSEMNIFCAVVESGFIVEQKGDEEKSRYGVAIWAPNFEKSKNPEYLTIYTITDTKGKFKVVPYKLVDFWPDETKIKINNKSDKTETPLSEETVRNQIMAAENAKRKWHNSEHFAYYCRYGPVATNVRIRKITDGFKWNTGTLFMKFRSLTAK